jgi:hypothetical protein
VTEPASDEPSAAPRPRVKCTWPSLNYTERSATCDTLHTHTQVLGKLAERLHHRSLGSNTSVCDRPRHATPASPAAPPEVAPEAFALDGRPFGAFAGSHALSDDGRMIAVDGVTKDHN